MNPYMLHRQPKLETGDEWMWWLHSSATKTSAGCLPCIQPSHRDQNFCSPKNSEISLQTCSTAVFSKVPHRSYASGTKRGSRSTTGQRTFIHNIQPDVATPWSTPNIPIKFHFGPIKCFVGEYRSSLSSQINLDQAAWNT